MTQYFAVVYRYADGSDDRRAALRDDHVAFLRGLYEARSLRVSGRLHDDDRAGALLVLAGNDAAAVTDLLDDDPFWSAQLVERRDVIAWDVVFGSEVLG